ncbi:uncharacterized protein LOC133745360 isoform X2 [Rosa rugosa]|uniref:uncharacterized protein LOC133745360 isoform X2 n=1 Tax=Rosa rugosa TaxID=74645 RepID=UPI002B40E000|nr:uncharacterized protein LOC133745360 isoform X2 [Rosa rugosa]
MTSLALTFLGGAPFQLLYEGVKKAIRKSNKFRTHLENLEMTLGCLQPWIIQQIRANNVQLNLPNNLIQDLEIKMEEGKELVYKLSRLGVWNIRVWGNCYNCIKPNYSDQLAELDRSLRLLLEILKLEEMRNVQENLLLARNHSDKQDDLDKKMSELLKVHQEVLKAQKEMFDMMRVQHEAVHEAMQRIRADAVQNVRGETAPAPAPALRIVFWVLYDVVIQVKVKNTMCKRLLQEFKSTLDFLKPLIEEMAESNKLLHLPEQEQEKFIIQMREGVELIDKCSKVSKWHSYKKYACTNKLLKLDESLRGLFHKMSMQIAIHVKEGLISISSMEAMIKKIEESGVIQNQIQVVLTKPQPPLHEAGLDVLDTHGSKDVEGTRDDLNEKEVGVKQIGRDGTRQNEKEIEGLSEVPETSSPKTTLDVQGTKDINESLDSESVHIAQTKQSQGTRVVEAPVAEYKFPFLMVEWDVHLRELKNKIFEDQVAMLVITGPAGCGKTTLARMFCEDQEVKMKFKNIFFVHVSENPSLDFIVQQLYEQKDPVVLELQEDAVYWLQQFLKETGGDPSLLVLDDVWSGSESLLEKFDELRTSMHKILVTSRSEFPRFGCLYYLESLKSLDDEEEMSRLKGKVVAAVRATGDYPERVGKPICEYYLKTGTCKFGPSCKFHHPKQGIGYLSSLYGLTQLSSPTHALERPYTSVAPSSVGPSSSSPNEQAFPERPGKPECQYYLRTGDCKFGPSCRYHHPRDRIAPRTNCLLSPVGLLGNSGSNAWPSFSQMSLSMEDFQTSLDLKLNAQHCLLQTPMSPCVSISRRISSNDKSSQSDVEDKSELDEIQSQISGVTVPESLHDPLESKDRCPMNVNNTLEYATSGTTPNSVNVDGQSVACNSSEIGSISQKQGVKEKVAFRTKSEVEILDDGFKWRKYGKKLGKNSTNPRNYYKCAYEGCPVKKRVERDRQDPSYVITCYDGVHNHTS